MKTDHCLLCNSILLKSSHQIKYLNNNYFYDFCLDCQFTFQNPWPPMEIEKIYNDPKYWNSSDVYNDSNNSEFSDESSYKAYQRKRGGEAQKRYEKLKKYLPSKGSVLEIGCANGIFLSEWKKNGWNCLGVDPAKEMIEYGIENYGLDLKCSKWEDLNTEKRQFDCITMWGTDGNFYDFKAGFNKINNSLKDNGIFAFTYQDFKHPIRKVFKQIKKNCFHVLYNFSNKSIYYLMDNLDFEIIEHSLTWQKTRFSHIKKILGLKTNGIDFNITVPAISYNLVVARKKPRKI